MAIDEAMLRWANDIAHPITTLRIYKWNPPAVSLGYAQKVDMAADCGFCRVHGIDIVRRPTGGRAVLHDQELTYAVVSNELEAFGGSGILDCYMLIARALHRALRAVGCPAEISPGTIHRKAAVSGAADAPCFLSTSRHEITAQGRKLIGSAQRRLKRAFLQHGSILLRCDYYRQAAALRTDSAKIMGSFAGLEEFVQGLFQESELRFLLVKSFEEVLHAGSQNASLTPEELSLAAQFKQTGHHLVSLG